MSIVTAPRPPPSRRSWPASTPRCSGSSGSGSTTRFSIWVGIRCRRCAWSPRSTPAWMPALSVRAVFEAPTVARLAPRIGGDAGRLAPLVADGAARGGSVVVCPEPVVVPRPVARGPHRSTTWRRRCGCAARLDAEALGAALADVVGRHESLRTLFPAVDGIPRQLVVPAERADFGWDVVDATRLAGKPAG